MTENGLVQQYPSKLEFQMYSCETAGIDNQSYPIGGMRTASSSNDSYTSTNTTTLEWNDKVNKEFLNFTSGGKYILFQLPGPQAWNSAGFFKIVNGKLIAEWKDGKSSATCEHIKK